VTGLLEAALYVADLDRAAGFYGRLFGWRLLLADERMRALDIAGRHVLLLFRAGASARPNPVPGGTVPPHDARGRIHLALAIPGDALAAWEARLAALDVAVEGRVEAERGGTSLYFRDPDGHLVELATPGLWPTY
jgi:catechol 2,3-dioxygenase-like lactoylglutathione lyase family enzyme